MAADGPRRSQVTSGFRRDGPARMSEFQRFIQQIVREHGTVTAVADGIAMSVSAFSRLVRNEDTLGVHSCLLLARFAGESPVKVLTLAGKRETADLAQELFGSERTPISALDRQLIALDPDLKREILRVVTLAQRKT